MSRLEGLVQFAKTTTLVAAPARNPERYARLANKLHVLADQEIGKVQAEAAVDGIVPDCGRGCDACCHRLVGAALPEILSVLHHVEQNFTEEQKALLRVRTLRLQDSDDDYWNLRSHVPNGACAFLVDGMCSIYEVRPMTCRARNCTDRTRCHEVYIEGKVLPVDDVPGQRDVIEMVGPVVYGLRDAGVLSGMFELGPTVMALLDDPDSLGQLSPGAPIEKLKISSEFSRDHRPAHPALINILQDPSKIQIISETAEGNANQVWDWLDVYRGSVFEAIFRHIAPHEYRSEAEIDSWLQRWTQASAALGRDELPSREVFEVLQQFDTYGLAYTARNVKEPLKAFMSACHHHARKALPQLTAPFDKPRQPGKIRVGLISDRISRFNGSRWAFGWLKNLGADVETFVLNMIENEDDVSRAFRRASDHYLHLPLMVSDAAPFIRSLDIDHMIFTDVGMSGPTIQLALLRLARNQYAAWGHPVTTGSPEMDFYLSSDLMEPENGQDHYTEKLIRLPGTGLTYPRSPLFPSGKTHAELGVPEGGYIAFCQVPHKVSPAEDAMFGEIAARSSKPLVFTGSPTKGAHSLLRERLTARGITAIFLPFQSQEDYLRIIQLADTCIDSRAWNGANTTIEALQLGTPVVTLPGEFMRGRHSKAFLTEAHAPGLIARDEEDFVSLVLDEDRQREAMKNVDADRLYENPVPARALSELLLNRS